VSGDALLAEVVEAHGGRESWQASPELVVQVSAGGLAVAAKLQRSGLRNSRPASRPIGSVLSSPPIPAAATVASSTAAPYESKPPTAA